MEQYLGVEVDPRFKEYFSEIQQVFLYITDDCGLACKQCLYKPWLRKGKEINLSVARSLLKEFRGIGASKLSLLGGEPFNYDELPSLVASAKEMGYQYIRLDTNGQFPRGALEHPALKDIDEITFSLDGHTPIINDSLRGAGSFEKCVGNIRRAIESGFNMDITCCVHRGNIGKDSDGIYLIEKMIAFASSLGVKRINFHPIFKTGVPRDGWQGETDISPLEWRSLYAEIKKRADLGKYEIPVRLPQRFIKKQEFEDKPAYFGYCPVKMGERVLVHPNGQIQICALMIGTPYSIARFELIGGKIVIVWETEANEIKKRNFDLSSPTPCTNQTRDFQEYVPLCISFKPGQKEFVWERLGERWALMFKGSKNSPV